MVEIVMTGWGICRNLEDINDECEDDDDDDDDDDNRYDENFGDINAT